MHHFEANFPKFPGGDPPDHPSAGGGVTPSPTLPLSALRASVKPSASLVTSAPPPPPPAMEVLDPPLRIVYGLPRFIHAEVIPLRPHDVGRLKHAFMILHGITFIERVSDLIDRNVSKRLLKR